MIQFTSLSALFDLVEREGQDMAELMIEREMDLACLAREEVVGRMEATLQVMEEAAEKGIKEAVTSVTGLTGGSGRKLFNHYRAGRAITGEILPLVMARAIGIAEVNAAMGKVVAAPTAGSCGIIPGVLLTLAEYEGRPREDLLKALFAASAIGLVIAEKAMLSGAEGGCQAECGSASAMAAGALVYLLGGEPSEIQAAVAVALKNMLGLVCDPVAGLVEVPCIKRNAAAAANALMAAELVLAGIESIIPADEVITAMGQIGRNLPVELRETSEGGLAATPTGCRLSRELFDADNSPGFR
ncbi:MAG: L-serine ammonia-lyase, iron-sulfur-dependent, subunit alpha [Halanaerobium sp.]|nr:L-serine ammonia-lyase, iron-sulfur-dependent, subunit alpha [Halanaerobium sp.]